MVSSEEIGNIIARLAIYDESFVRGMLQAASVAGDRLLPDDLEKLTTWAAFMRAFRQSLAAQSSKEEA